MIKSSDNLLNLLRIDIFFFIWPFLWKNFILLLLRYFCILATVFIKAVCLWGRYLQQTKAKPKYKRGNGSKVWDLQEGDSLYETSESYDKIN